MIQDGTMAGRFGFIPSSPPKDGDALARAYGEGKVGEYRWWRTEGQDPGAKQVLDRVLEKKSPSSAKAVRDAAARAGGVVYPTCGKVDPTTRVPCSSFYDHRGLCSYEKQAEAESERGKRGGRKGERTSGRARRAAQFANDPRMLGCDSAFPINVDDLYSVSESEARMRALLSPPVVLPPNRGHALAMLKQKMNGSRVGVLLAGASLPLFFEFSASRPWPDDLWVEGEEGRREVNPRYLKTGRGKARRGEEDDSGGGKVVRVGLLRSPPDGGGVFVKDPLDVVVEMVKDGARRRFFADGPLVRCALHPFECRPSAQSCYGVLRASLHALYGESARARRAAPVEEEAVLIRAASALSPGARVQPDQLSLLSSAGSFRDAREERAAASLSPLRLVESDDALGLRWVRRSSRPPPPSRRISSGPLEAALRGERGVVEFTASKWARLGGPGLDFGAGDYVEPERGAYFLPSRTHLAVADTLNEKEVDDVWLEQDRLGPDGWRKYSEAEVADMARSEKAPLLCRGRSGKTCEELEAADLSLRRQLAFGREDVGLLLRSRPGAPDGTLEVQGPGETFPPRFELRKSDDRWGGYAKPEGRVEEGSRIVSVEERLGGKVVYSSPSSPGLLRSFSNPKALSRSDLKRDGGGPSAARVLDSVLAGKKKRKTKESQDDPFEDEDALSDLLDAEVRRGERERGSRAARAERRRAERAGGTKTQRRDAERKARREEAEERRKASAEAALSLARLACSGVRRQDDSLLRVGTLRDPASKKKGGGPKVCVLPVLPDADPSMPVPVRGDPAAIAQCKDSSLRSLYPYQRFVASTVTPSSGRNLLVVHSTGSGKTCTMVAIVSSFLVHNLSSPFPIPILIVAPPKNLQGAYSEIVGGCGVVKVQKSGSDTDEVACRRAGIFGYSYVEFANRALGKTADDRFPINPLVRQEGGGPPSFWADRCLILFDEAHNFAPEPLAHEVTDPDGSRRSITEDSKRAGEAWSFLKRHVPSGRVQIVLLTATPIKREPSEIGKMLNLLLTREQQDADPGRLPPTAPSFNSRYSVSPSSGLVSPAGLARFREDASGLLSYYDASLDVARFPTMLDRGLRAAYARSGSNPALSASLSSLFSLFPGGGPPSSPRIGDAGRFGVLRVPASRAQYARWTECVQEQSKKKMAGGGAADEEEKGRAKEAAAAAKAAKKWVAVLRAVERALGRTGPKELRQWAEEEGVRSDFSTAVGRILDQEKGPLPPYLSVPGVTSPPLLADKAAAKRALAEAKSAAEAAASGAREESQRASGAASERRAACRRIEELTFEDPEAPGEPIVYLVNPNVVGGEEGEGRLGTQLSASNMIRASRTDGKEKGVSRERVEVPPSQLSPRFDAVRACPQQKLVEYEDDGGKGKAAPRWMVSGLLNACYSPSPSSGRASLRRVLADEETGISTKLWALVQSVTTLAGKHFVFTSSVPSTGVQAVAAALWCAGLVQRGFTVSSSTPEGEEARRTVQRLEARRKRLTAAEAALLAEEREKAERGREWRADPPPAGGEASFVVLPTTTNASLLSAMLSLFNSPSNSEGGECKVLVANLSYNQGISLFAVHWTHLFDAPTDYTTRTQALARAIRLCGSVRGGQEDAGEWFNVVLAYATTAPPGEGRDADRLPLLTDGEAMVRCVRQLQRYEAFLCAAQEAAIDRGLWKAVPGNDACGAA